MQVINRQGVRPVQRDPSITTPSDGRSASLASLRRRHLVLGAALAPLARGVGAQAEPRLALLIGNSAYKSAPLVNPVNDVRLMAQVLGQVGFSVIKAEDASLREMRRLVREFGDRLRASGGVGLFYFAGHGVQVRGENYMISIDSDIRHEDEVADDAVNANVVLDKMQSAGNRMNIIILDACRNNPFAIRSRNAAAGLAVMNAPSGSIVAYATAPGSVASDGDGRNGLYTQHLARAIREPGLPVEEVFKQVRTAVRRDSGNQQTPWENTALEGQFFFMPPGPGLVSAPATATATARLPAQGTIQAGAWIGTLVMTDNVTRNSRSIDVSVLQTNALRTVYSTGDVVGANGSVLQVRVGDAVLLATSGELWKIPLQAGATGQAMVERVDVQPAAAGSLSWRSAPAKDGRVRIEAQVSYRNVAPSGEFFVTVSGTWSALYDGVSALPESFTAAIQAANPSIPGSRNLISAEFKSR